MEIYKTLVIQKGILFIIVLVYVLMTFKIQRGVDYTNTNYMVNKFYKEFDGRAPDEDVEAYITDLRDGQTWKTTFHPSLFLSPARYQCSNIFSIKIPYPLLASCTNTCVTAPASFPSCMIGEPLTSESSNGQHFLSVFIYDIITSF